MDQENTITVDVQNVSAGGAYIDAWLDWDADGSWGSFQDHIIDRYFVPSAGTYQITTGPGFGTAGDTYARVRVSQNGTFGPLGYSGDGEVEDYQVDLRPPVYDFGDAPASYITSLSTTGPNGAHHAPQGVQLGASRDAEEDGIASVDATGDDADNLRRCSKTTCPFVR